MKLFTKHHSLIDRIKDIAYLGLVVGVLWTAGVFILQGIYHEELDIWERVMEDYNEEKMPAVNVIRVDEKGQLWYVDVDLQEYPAYRIDEYSDEWFTQYGYMDKKGNEHFAN